MKTPVHLSGGPNDQRPEQHTAAVARHTPGIVSYLPMRSGDGYNYGGGLIVTFGERSLFLGEVSEQRGYNNETVELARLIASAPELLAALTRAERKLTAYVGVCSGDKELRETVLPMALAALAKATGNQ